MQDQGPTVSFCPSFSTYSSGADIAAQVAKAELVKDHLHEDRMIFTSPRNHNKDVEDDCSSSSSDEDDDFEFVLLRANPEGNDGTAFPVFNRDLLSDSQNGKTENQGDTDVIRIPLEKLFIDDRDHPSSSSSEADELEGISPGSYCVWRPSKAPSSLPLPSPSRCEKSNSTGSSSKQQQRWRLRDLLHLKRSRSDGKESFIFLSNNNSNNNDNSDKKSKGKRVVSKGKEKERDKKKGKGVSAHEVFYVRNKAMKEGDRRRSYLPYRQGLVGTFFSNVNGLGRSFPPF